MIVFPWGLLTFSVGEESPFHAITKKNTVVPLIIVIGSVASVLLLFLVVQWPYVFANVAAEVDLSKFGVATYSEYVKRGFTELLMVAVIVYSLLWMGLTSYRSHKHKEGNILLVLQTVTTALFLVFIVSVMRRILLYWDLHGLSLIRIYGGLFLLLVSSFTVSLYFRHITKIRFIGIELATLAIFLSILGIWNQESFIINNHPPTVNGQVDYVYLTRLSEDGVDGWVRSFQFANSILEKNELYTKPLLTGEDRRDIAYAGYIVSIFTHHYDRLIRLYGSDTEQKAYQDTLTDVYVQAITEQMAQHKNDIQVQNMKIEEYWKQMSEAKSQISTRAVSLAPRSTISMTQFFEGPCSQWSANISIVNCVPSFYTVHEQPHEGSPSFLDMVFIWNASAARAYSLLKTAVPVSSLLATQKKYIFLIQRIYSQLPEERGYVLDISLDAPLLEPIW
jgi:hypothetical protein